MLLIDFWIRALKLQQQQLESLRLWAEPAQSVLNRLNNNNNNNSNNNSTANFQQRLEFLLVIADKYGITCKLQQQLDDWCKQEQDWRSRAVVIVARQKLLLLDNLKEFIRQGDRLICVLCQNGKELLAKLKIEHRAGKNWLQRFAKQGNNNNNNNNGEMQLLLSEAKEICVDLSEQVGKNNNNKNNNYKNGKQ